MLTSSTFGSNIDGVNFRQIVKGSTFSNVDGVTFWRRWTITDFDVSPDRRFLAYSSIGYTFSKKKYDFLGLKYFKSLVFNTGL